MTDKFIFNILNAYELLQKTIDPEGILSKGKITRITHQLSENNISFSWKADVNFPDNGNLRIYGQYHKDIKFIINRCRYTIDNEKYDMPLNPSETLLSAIEDISLLPDSIRAKLAKIRPRNPVYDNLECQYGNHNVESGFYALFCGVDGGEKDGPLRSCFKEITFSIRKEPDGFFTKTNIVATCNKETSIIRTRITVDMYGLSSNTVTLEKNFGDNDEISAYCYTEDISGRKIPSLKVAFKLDKLLSGKDDVHQHVKRNHIDYPSSELSSQPKAELAAKQQTHINSDSTPKHNIHNHHSISLKLK